LKPARQFLAAGMKNHQNTGKVGARENKTRRGEAGKRKKDLKGNGQKVFRSPGIQKKILQKFA